MNVNEETSQVNETVDTQATEQDSKMKPSEDVESTKTYTQEQLDAIAADIRRKSEVKSGSFFCFILFSCRLNFLNIQINYLL